jgi:AcrR family transcriptional regulator
VAEKGRRPGKRDTRAEIVVAAAAAFAEGGFEATSLRAVAGRAGVDPALVHHYFPKGKSQLFNAAMEGGPDARLILDVVLAEDHTQRVAAAVGAKGEIIVAHFIQMWDVAAAETGDPFVSFTQAAASSPEAAAGVRTFLAERIWAKLGDEGRPADELAQRRALIASQLMGLGFARYVLRLEPVASADPDELGRWVGPTIDRYADGPLPPSGPPHEAAPSVEWLPDDFVHPERWEVDAGHHFRPIRADDVDLDYPAVMGSRDRLWSAFGAAWGWPPSDMTYEQDRTDLARHEREIASHESFNYALFDADETALLGCLYLDPPEKVGADAEISWWVVDDLAGSELEAGLTREVPGWIAREWPFERPRYVGRDLTWDDWLALPDVDGDA